MMKKTKKPPRCCLVLVSKGLMHRCSALIKKDQLKYKKKKTTKNYEFEIKNIQENKCHRLPQICCFCFVALTSWMLLENCSK